MKFLRACLNKGAITTSAVLTIASCKTTTTGGKLVDRSRGEVYVSSAGDSPSAMPEASKDDQLTATRKQVATVIKKNPNDIASLLNLAQLQLAQDMFDEAEATCRRVLQFDIKNKDAKKILAQLALRQRNHELAMIFLNALDGEASRDSGVINMIALVHLAQGNSDRAMSLWKKALTLNSNDISVRMNLGVLYLKYRLLSQASAQFERVIKVSPAHQDARLHLAIIQSARGQNEQAITVYKELLAEDKTNSLVLYNLAVAEKSMARYDDALETLKRFLRASSNKSIQTNQAFAMIEEIQNLKRDQGESVSDEEIANLSQALERKSATAENKPRSKPVTTAPTEAPTPAASPTTTDSKLGHDQDIEELEGVLRAH